MCHGLDLCTLVAQIRSLLSFELHSHHWKPRLIKHLLTALLKWKDWPISAEVASEAMHQLLRLQSYAGGGSSNDERGTCTAMCSAHCNPHKLGPCRKSCRSRCKQELRVKQLLKQLVQKAQAEGHDVQSLFRRHLRNAHRSHHQLAARHSQQASSISEKAQRVSLQVERAHTDHEVLYAKHKAARTYTGRAETPKQPPRFKDAKHEENAGKAREWAEKREVKRLAAEAEVNRRRTSSSGGVHPIALPVVMSMLHKSVTDNSTHPRAYLATGQMPPEGTRASAHSQRRQFSTLDFSWRANRTKAAELTKITDLQMSAVLTSSRHVSHVNPKFATLGRGWSILRSIGRDPSAFFNELHEPSPPAMPLRHPVSAAPPYTTAVVPYNERRKLESENDANSTDACLPMPVMGSGLCLPFPPSKMSFELIPSFLAFENWGITASLSVDMDAHINEFKDEVKDVLNRSKINGTFVANATNITASDIASRIGELLLSIIDNITISGRIVLGSENDITSVLTLDMEGIFYGNTPYSLGTNEIANAPATSFDEDGNPVAAAHALRIQSNRWTPLKAVSFLTVPALDGTAYLTRQGGFVLEVMTEPFNVTVVPGFFELFSMVLEASYESESAADESGSGAPAQEMTGLDVGFESVIRVGGSAGFEANLIGSVDTVKGEANLTLTHLGGWSPLPGELGKYISTPKFEGEVAINVGGVYLDMKASVTMTAPLDLVPGLVRITGIPEDWYDTWAREHNYKEDDPPAGLSILEGSGEAEGPTLSIGYQLETEPPIDSIAPPPKTICDILNPPGQTSIFPAGCTCEPIDTALGSKVTCVGTGVPAIPEISVPEIPISLSAVIAPCGKPNAYFEVATSVELPGSASPEFGVLMNKLLQTPDYSYDADIENGNMDASYAHETNTFTLSMKVSAGKAMAFPFPVYMDPAFAIYVKFIVVAQGNIQEFGLKLSIDVCVQVLGFDMFCGNNLPSCDPLPSVYEIYEGLSATKAICMATGGYINFQDVFFNPPYVLADVAGLSFNGVCELERRRLSVSWNESSTLGTTAHITPPAVPRLFGPHAHVDFFRYGGKNANVHRPALPSSRDPSMALHRRLQGQSNNSTGNMTNETDADNGGMPPVTVGVAGRVIIGSDEGGFRADLTGEVDLQQRAATFTIAHDGGWSPIAALSDILATPAFEGSVAMNVDGVPLAVTASVSLLEPLTLAGGIVEIGAVPCDQKFTGIGRRPVYGDSDCTEAEDPEGACSRRVVVPLACCYMLLTFTCCATACRPDNGNWPHVPTTNATSNVLRDVWPFLDPGQREPARGPERLLRADLH